MLDEGDAADLEPRAPDRGPYELATIIGVLVTSFAAIVLAFVSIATEDWKIALSIVLGLLLFLNFLVASGWLRRLEGWWQTREFASRIREHPEFVREVAAISRESRLVFVETNRADSIHNAIERILDEARRQCPQTGTTEARDIGELEGLRQSFNLLPQWWAPVEAQIAALAANPQGCDSYSFQRGSENLGDYMREAVETANRFLQRARQCTWYKPTDYTKDAWAEFAVKANEIVGRFGGLLKRAEETAKIEVRFYAPRLRELH